jgi:hypothetical protein
MIDDYSSHAVELITPKIHFTDNRTLEITQSEMSKEQLDSFTENIMDEIGKNMADEIEKDLLSGKLRIK